LSGTIRLRGVISYDGSRFFGFAKQPDRCTVAGKIEEAFSILNTKTVIEASGRTDAGVHAQRQVFHCDVPLFWQDNFYRLRDSLKEFIRPNIGLLSLEIIDNIFHSRFCAKKRLYRYVISDKEPTPFLEPYVMFVNGVDFDKIKIAIKLFEGEHDFEYFKKMGGSSKTSIRTIHKANAYRYKEFYILTFLANGFLYSQVRMMANFLIKIGDGRLKIEQLKEQINKKYQHNSEVASPNGLYLSRVFY